MRKFGKKIIAMAIVGIVAVTNVDAQCSVCTKTAEQLGEKPGKGLNAGILYLMSTPLVALGYIGYRWWKREKQMGADR